MIFSDLTTKNTQINPISAEEKLVVTLVFLANGTSYRRLSLNFRLGVETISRIVSMTCTAIWNRLKETYLALPQSSDEWIQIADFMHSRWQLSNSVGKKNQFYSKILKENI